MGKLSHRADHLSMAFSAWSHPAEIRRQHVAFTRPGKGGWRQGVLGAAPHLVAGGGCSSAWGKGSWASLLHDVTEQQNGLSPLTSVPCGSVVWLQQRDPCLPMSTGSLLDINCLLLCSAFLKSSTFNFHVLNPGLGKLCCVWGMVFHHSFPSLSSQVGHPARLAGGSVPRLAAQLLVCEITESGRALGARQWQTHSSQSAIHSSVGMPGFTSVNSPHHGLGHGGVSPAMHSHPSLVVTLGWEEISFWCRENLAQPGEKGAVTLG